jgi:hypothetical protein
MIEEEEREWLENGEEEEEGSELGEKEPRREKTPGSEAEEGEIVEVRTVIKKAKVYIPSHVRKVERKKDEKEREVVYLLAREKEELKRKLESGALTVKKVVKFHREQRNEGKCCGS